MTVRQLKEKRDELVLAALDMAVILRPWSLEQKYPDSVCNPDGTLRTDFGDLGFKPAGEIQKKAGLDITPDAKSVDIEGYGSKAARRKIRESESVTLDFTAQESRKLNMSIFWDIDESDWVSDGSGGVKFTKRSQATVNYWTVMLIGNDSLNGKDIYPWWLFPKAFAEKSGKMSLADSAEMAFGITLAAMEDPIQGLFEHGLAGPGWADLSSSAGFEGLAAAPYEIRITGGPTGGTYTLSVGGTASASIAYNASSSTVQTALEGITGVGAGKVAVTGSSSQGFIAVFDSSVTGALTATSTGLTGGTAPSVNISR